MDLLTLPIEFAFDRWLLDPGNPKQFWEKLKWKKGIKKKVVLSGVYHRFKKIRIRRARPLFTFSLPHTYIPQRASKTIAFKRWDAKEYWREKGLSKLDWKDINYQSFKVYSTTDLLLMADVNLKAHRFSLSKDIIEYCRERFENGWV